MTYPLIRLRAGLARRFGCRGILAAFFAGLLIALAVPSARAANSETKDFDIPAGEAGATLSAFSAQAGSSARVLYSADAVVGVQTHMVKGRFTALEAIDLMLAGTALQVQEDDATGTITVHRRAPAVSRPPPAAESSTPKMDNDEEAVLMSPFTIRANGNHGFTSEQVISGRYANNMLEMPASVTVINREQIEDLNATNLEQLIATGVSGVALNSTDFDDINIRGFRNSNQLIDGSNARSFERNELYDVERVEVIKGPGGLVLGNASVLGGAVNFVTRKPTPTPQGNVQFTAGNKKNFHLEATSSGPFSAKDTSEQYRFTIGGNTGGRDKDNEKDDELFLGGALSFRFNDYTSLSFTSSYINAKSFIYYEDYLNPAKLPNAVLSPYTNVEPGQKGISTDDYVVAHADIELLTRLSTNNNFRFYYSFYNFDESTRDFVRGLSLSADGLTLNRQRIPGPIKSISHDIQADYINTLERDVFTNKLMGGTDIQLERLDQEGYTFAKAYAPLSLVHPDYSGDAAIRAQTPLGHSVLLDRYNTTSWYVQDNLTILKKIILVAGWRWIDPAHWETSSNTTVNNNAETVLDLNVKTTPTYKYGAVYMPASWLSVYYTKASNLVVRTGFLDTLAAVPHIPLLDSDFNLNEGGVKLMYNHDRWDAYTTLTYFDMAETNIPINTINSAGVTIQSQVAQSTSKGWEFESGTGIKFPDGRADVLITYYNAKTLNAATGLTLPDAPQEIFSALLKYNWTGGPLRGFLIGAGMHQQSTKISGGYYDAWPVTYNAFSRYAFTRNWSLQANVDNLTDERYVVAAVNPAISFGSLTRSIRVSARYSW